MNKTLKTLRIKVGGANLRTAKYEERDHYVVPVVALVEGVIHAVNAEAPEFVPAEELSKAPAGWNGRPVVMNHPTINGEKVSANAPEVLEHNAFGLVFNSKFEDNSLKCEAWLDPIKATKVGPEAVKTLERIKKGEMIEVSVGVFVAAEQKSGEHEGKEYSAVWRQVMPDHLALLGEGTKGACSNEMGCGAPRVAEFKRWLDEDDDSKKKRLDSKTVTRHGADESVSDLELRGILDAALRADEPGYQYIEEIFPMEKQVVYWVMPEDKEIIYMRGYGLNDEDAATLTDDRDEVRRVYRYEKVSAAQEGDTAMTMCCEKKVALLISRGIFAEAEKEVLEQLDEVIVDKMIAATEPVEEPKGPETEDEWLKAMPENMAKIINDHHASLAQEKSDLVTELSESQKAFTKEELEAKDTAELKKLKAAMAVTKPEPEPKKVDHSAKAPRTAADNTGAPPPPSLSDAIAKRRGL